MYARVLSPSTHALMDVSGALLSSWAHRLVHRREPHGEIAKLHYQP